MEGAVANQEGKCLVYNLTDTLTISHMGYKSAKQLFSAADSNRIVYLVPSEVLLGEVNVYAVDLKEMLRNVETKVQENYQTKTLNYGCTYRELIRIDDSLRRLFQVQLDWYTKKGVMLDFKKPYQAQNQMRLTGIDYSRIMSDSISENGGFIENHYLFQLLKLNYYFWYILYHVEGIAIKEIELTDNA
jgi:hypothetical protein